MYKRIVATGLLAIGLCASPLLVSAQDADADRAHPGAFVKDSAITAKIKTKLAAEHITSLAKIKVDTDADGVVWLTGKAGSAEAVAKAESLAVNTDGVRSVKNSIIVQPEK
jgi:hyperosmotically inducible protein